MGENGIECVNGMRTDEGKWRNKEKENRVFDKGKKRSGEERVVPSSAASHTCLSLFSYVWCDLFFVCRDPDIYGCPSFTQLPTRV